MSTQQQQIDGLLSVKQVAARLSANGTRIKPNTVLVWIRRHGGLEPAATVGRSKLYRPEDVDKWAAQPRRPRGRPRGRRTESDHPFGWLTTDDVVSRLAGAGFPITVRTLSVWVARGRFPKAEFTKKGHKSAWSPQTMERGIAQVRAWKGLVPE